MQDRRGAYVDATFTSESTSIQSASVAGLGYLEVFLTQPIQVHFDGSLHLPEHRRSGLAGGDVPRKVRHERAVIPTAAFDEHQIPAHFRPACITCLAFIVALHSVPQTRTGS